MALDNANFISELSITDPPGSDPLSQGDDQIRATKRALQQSLPLIDKAVNITADQMNLMAIKNEANVFTLTGNRFTNQIDIKKSSASQLGGHVYFDATDVGRWGWFMSTVANGEPMTLQRRDVLGAVIDLPFKVRLTDGVAEFTQLPEIGGVPLWVAGEVRTFVNTVTLPTGWFVADGTNGTKNLQDRWLVGAGAFSAPAGTGINAALNSVTTATGITGSTILTQAQMPSHDHGLLGASTLGVSAGLLQSNARGCMGAGSITPSYVFTTGFGDNLMQATGGNAGHTHTDGGNALVLGSPTFTDTVQPVSMAVAFYQFVP